MCLCSQWVTYGLGLAHLNNSWGFWSFLLSWGPHRNGQEWGHRSMRLFLANCSLTPDFQQLCMSFLCGNDVWVGRIPFCGSAWADSRGHQPRANPYFCGLGHTSEAPRDATMFSWESATLRVQNPVWMVEVHPTALSVSASWDRKAKCS